jgi:hypothetical protein
MTRTPPPPSHPDPRPLVEELESRLLLSADLQPVPLDPPDAEAEVDRIAHVELVDDVQTTISASESVRHEVVFVDAGVENRDVLVDELLGAATESRTIDVFVLDANADGVAQISDFLDDHENLSAVHIISHGSEAALQLGDTWLADENLETYAPHIAAWGDALNADADLLLYGCDLAADGTGAGFVESLAKLTGADVAASDDPTGAAVLGGDWDLEHRVGSIEASSTLLASSAWSGTLADQPPENQVPGDQTTPVDSQLLFSDANGNGVSVSDPDAGSAEIEITLTITNGTVTIAGPSDPVDVNTETTSTQTTPRVARDLAGNTVVVWASQDQDADGFGIFAQLYDTAGNPVGGEFQVHTQEWGDQSEPAIAMAANGDFVVVWQSMDQDGDSWGVYGQRFDASGVAQGAEFQVHTQTANEQMNADVAMDDAGNFIVVWQSMGQDGDGAGVYAQRFDAGGAAQGGEIAVTTETSLDQSEPAVAMDSNGDFVVVWQSLDQDGDSWGIFGQRFDATGAAQGSEFAVNTETAKDQTGADVAMDDVGNFVVTWQSFDQDGGGWGVFAQRYDAAGASQGAEFQVNSTTTQEQSSAAVAMDSDGDFAVTWQGGPGNLDVYVQQYGADGTAVGGETQISNFTGGDQHSPDIAMDGDGDHFVVWEGKTSGGQDDEVAGSNVPYAKNITYLTGDGVDDGVIVMRGTIEDLNDALDGMLFTPTSGFEGVATIEIRTDDLGNTGAAPLIDTDTITIHVGGANDAPVLDPSSDLVLTDVYEDDANPVGDTVGAILASGGSDPIQDADGDPDGIAVVGVDDSHGTWQYSTDAGGSWTDFGAVSDANAVLLDETARIRFVPDADWNGNPGDLTFRAWDQTAGASGDSGVPITATGGTTPYSDATESATLEVLPQNDLPTQSVPGAQATNEDTTLLFSSAAGNAIAIRDADVGATDIQVKLTATGGKLSLAGTAGLSLLAGTGSDDVSVTFVGSENAINAALDGLRYQPDADWSGAGNLSVETTDAQGGVVDDIAITVAPVNDAPTQSVPGAQAADASGMLVFSSAGANAISISDVDASVVQVTLRATAGTLTLGSTAGISLGAGTGTDDVVVTFSGTLAAVNGALDGLQFRSEAGFDGVATLDITTDDLGGSGSGGPQTAIDSVLIAVDYLDPSDGEDPEEPEPTDETEDPDEPGPEEVPTPGVAAGPFDPNESPRRESPAAEEATSDREPAAPLAPPAPLTLAAPEATDPEPVRDASSHTSYNPVLAGARLDSALDALREDLTAEADVEEARSETVFANVRAMALALSTGLLTALLRGGSLLALTFSSLPLWKGFDPLAVLAMTSVERKRRQQEMEAEEAAENRDVARLLDED